jgi:hypothetical protein
LAHGRSSRRNTLTSSGKPGACRTLATDGFPAADSSPALVVNDVIALDHTMWSCDFAGPAATWVASRRREIDPGGGDRIGNSRVDIHRSAFRQFRQATTELLRERGAQPLVEAGKIKPVVERRNGLNEVVEAFRYLGTGNSRAS